MEPVGYEYKSYFTIILGEQMEDKYYKCSLTDHLGFHSDGYVCERVNAEDDLQAYKFASENTSEYILRTHGLVKHENAFYIVWEKFHCTLEGWINTHDKAIQNFAGFLDDIINGVEELHHKFKVKHGNINASNIFIVQEALGKPYIAKLGHVCPVPLEVNATTNETQIEEYMRDDHESVWNIVDGGIFSEEEGLDHELQHFVKLEKRCACEQFSFYRYHPVKMDEDQRCGMRLYTTSTSNFAMTTIVRSVGQSIDALEMEDGGRRQNVHWKSNVMVECQSLRSYASYGTNASEFLRFSRDAVGHINQVSNVAPKNFKIMDQDFNHMWRDFMCLLFDGFIRSKMWSFSPWLKGQKSGN